MQKENKGIVMVEYGVKKIITNPKIMSESQEIIKVVDLKTHKTKAFIIPAIYSDIVEKIEKDLHNRKWIEEKKKVLQSKDDALEDVMEAGIESIKEYLEKE